MFRCENSCLFNNDDTKTIFQKPMELFSALDVVKICAPMVRYSRLPFRCLVRKYNCDLAFTPMIVSRSFVQSTKARDSDFTTNSSDRPLVVQFAANNAKDFADAAEIVYQYSDGIDLNCGCPQRWAMQEGYGACLLDKPEHLSDIVSHARNRLCDEKFSISIKIRIHEDIRQTVEMCRRVEKAGISWITVHGRTKKQHHQPVNLDAIRLIKQNLSVPVVANGDIKSMSDVARIKQETGVDGVMSARGMLSNPALYAGFDETPLQCVQDWVDLALQLGTPFSTFHHHLMYMLENVTSKAEKRLFNSLNGTSAVLDYLNNVYGISYRGNITNNVEYG